MTTVDLIRGIPANDVAESYHRLGIDQWSDNLLISSVAEILSHPRSLPADSFVLHAPLELVARGRLLPMVTPADRKLARMHLLDLAVSYEHAGPGLDTALGYTSTGRRSIRGEPISDLLRALDDGDLDGVDAVAVDLINAKRDPHTVIDALADQLIARTGAAAHAPILLSYLASAGRPAHELLLLLRPLVRELARMPKAAITWCDDATTRATTPTATASLAAALSTTPRLGIPGSTFIHPLMMQVDRGGLAAAHLGGILGDPSERVSANDRRSVLRTAARSMICDTPDFAPYGWTHCLTLPQAVLNLATHLLQPQRGLAIAATYVMAFRAAMSEVDLDHDAPLPDPGPDPWQRRERLASAAATRHDAHIVKYALAVIEESMADPAAAGLYLAAGERLIEVWDDNGGDPEDALAP